MTLSQNALANLDEHWAVSAVGLSDVEEAKEQVRKKLAQQSVGGQIEFSFVSDLNTTLLERVALAYEMAAIEGLGELGKSSGDNVELRDQSTAASFESFNIKRVMSLPSDINDLLFFVLQISATAYCGERWSDLRRWYKENQAEIQIPKVDGTEWDQRLLYQIFDCWTRLFRKEGWEDLHRISEIIAKLRHEQKLFEGEILQNESDMANKITAFRLIALYHWAKGTEILAKYILQGEPADPFSLLDKHFEAGVKAAEVSRDAQHEIILRWLHVTARVMISNSLWWATRRVNSKMTKFVHSLATREHKAMFELLPPQRAALLEQGLLDQAKTAIVIDMPTSGGKTLLAQFRILQALNQFQDDNGWVAYVAPTRALSAQITRQLRRDFDPIDIIVEQLTAAIEVDAFEEELLMNPGQAFHVLVATPEKLSLVIRNKKVSRPLALVVMDEAHNMESEDRGLRMELLLATIRRDCSQANFLLLMPYVEDIDSVANWLAQDRGAGQAISLSSIPWQPNERIIGLYSAAADDSLPAGWHLKFETLTVTRKTMKLHGTHRVGGVKPISVPKNRVISRDEQKGLSLQTAAIATIMSARGTSIAVADTINTVWKMAGDAASSLPDCTPVSPDIKLVQDFLRTEISHDFQLIKMLEKGVGIHHAGLSDDTRALMEWLAEKGQLKVLCATTTIAQGINFPVSSVFLQTRNHPYGKEMSPREFWNLAGRAGRVNHESVGVVGIAAGKNSQGNINFVNKNTGALISRLVTLMDQLAEKGELASLESVLHQEQWEDFRCYIAHLCAEKENLDAVLADSEQLLRQTYGYTSLRSDPEKRERAEALLKATQDYAQKLVGKSGFAKLTDSTGFSPEGVGKAISEMRSLEFKLTRSDWAPESLFGRGGKLADLYGVILKVPQLKRQLGEIGGEGSGGTFISEITRDWVHGKGIETIAREYFKKNGDENGTMAITEACRTIYKRIINSGTWGISALSHFSGLDFDDLSETERRKINTLPAMIYHGVRTEDAVLMRMNSAPRSVAERLGNFYRHTKNDSDKRFSVGEARQFLKKLSKDDWHNARPDNASLTGDGYRHIWRILSGESHRS